MLDFLAVLMLCGIAGMGLVLLLAGALIVACNVADRVNARRAKRKAEADAIWLGRDGGL